MRMTYSTAMVIQALDHGFRYGFDIAEATGLRGGTVYPILRRLKEAGMVQAEWEPVAVSRDEGRPPRRYYSLTDAADEFLVQARRRFLFRMSASEAQEDLG